MKTNCFYLLITLLGLFQTVQPDYHTIYAHGIVDGPAQMNRFNEAINTPATALSFPDTQSETGYGINRLVSEISTYCGKPVNRSKMYMGQDKDISTVHEAMQTLQAGMNTVLYGCSRGAATLINYMAQHNPEGVRAMVLDAPPCNMPQATHAILAKLGLHQSWDKALFSNIFPAYPAQATTPLQAVKDINNKELPILLVHSQQDSKVRFINSLYLYLEFKRQGFNHVHLATIPSGRHSFLLQDEAVKARYLQAVHSFYKAYGLPHNPEHATANIADYQYDTQQASNEIAAYEQALQEQYEYSQLRNLVATGAAATAALALALYKQQ